MKNALTNKINFSQNQLSKEVEPGKPEKKRFGKKLKIFLLALGSLILFLAIFVPIFGVMPVLDLRKDAEKLSAEAQEIYGALQSQDLNLAVTKVQATNQELENLKKNYRRLVWVKYIPFFGNYYRDGEYLIAGGGHLLEAADMAVKALEPYADILGLEGEEKKEASEMTAEERLFLALDTLDKIQPHLDEIGEKLKLAQEEINQIDPGRYPEEVRGVKVREKIVSLISAIEGTAELATEIKPMVGFLKPLLGVPDKKTYLLLFQNDAELRPTGGFMTAYALLTVDNGKVIPGASFDIYTLDARFGNRLQAPDPIKNYLPKVNYWHIRDMNLSPDFVESMNVFWENASKVIGNSSIDGIISVDTKVLVDIIEVLGPIGVAGWGNFSAENDPRCDCPQVFYELELYADKPVGEIRQERKGIIGPLMHSIMLHVMGSPRKKWPEFFNIGFKNIQEKHILLYFFDEEVQKAVEALNAGGRIKDAEGDYFHFNDTNFGGAKSNMFIQQEVTQDIEVAGDGTVTKTVTIDYRNPAPPSNCNLEAGELCLNGLYRNWFRLYVPEGSQLMEAKGSEVDIKTYEELGKTVFEGFYGNDSPLRPEGKAQVSFKYRLPFKVQKGDDYQLLIQKQPGTKNYQYHVTLGGQAESFELTADKELRLSY